MKQTAHKFLSTPCLINHASALRAKLSVVRRSLLLLGLALGYVGFAVMPQAASWTAQPDEANPSPFDLAAISVAPAAFQAGQTPGQVALEAARLKLVQARQAFALSPNKKTATALAAAQTAYNQAVTMRSAEIRARLRQIFGSPGLSRKGTATRPRPSATLLAEARTLTTELRSYDKPAVAHPRLAACPTAETITQSSSQAITSQNSYSCNSSGLHSDNSYWRAFSLPSFGITDNFNVSAVAIGVESAVAGSEGTQPITVRIYEQTSGTFPSGTRNLLSSVNTFVPDVASGTVFSIPILAALPAGATMIVEIFTPDGQADGHSFFIGSNADAETGPSYLSAPTCEIVNPTDLASLEFPNMNIVMNVVGCEGPAEPTPTPTPTPCVVKTASYSGPAVAIPDSNATGVNIVLPVSGVGTLADLDFRFDTGGDCDATEGNTDAAVDHTWVSDLTFKLTSPGGTTITFIDRIGFPANEVGNSGNNFCLTTLDDDGGFPAIEDFMGEPVTGDFAPSNPFSVFDGQNPNGNWILNVSDTAEGDLGSVRRFSLIFSAACPCTMTCPVNVVASNTSNQCSAVVTYPAPVTTGDCGAVTCSLPSGSTFNVGTTMVTCEASDARTPACRFTVTVNDTQAPTVTVPGPMTVNAANGTCAANVPFTATAADNCSGATASCTPSSNSSFPVGTTTVSCKAMDVAGNMSAASSFTVRVNDTQVPTVTLPGAITANAANGTCAANIMFTATAADNCPGATVNCTPASNSSFPIGATTVTCKATDATGNMSANATFTVTVQDRQAPVLSACPANRTLSSAPNGNPTAATYLTPTATDNCGTAAVVCLPPSGALFPVGTTTVTCTASDTSSDSADTRCTFTVTVTQFMPAPTATLVDPLNCTGAGDVVNGSFGVANPSAVAQTGRVTVALPPEIIGLSGSCVANVGTCVVTATMVVWDGTLPANGNLSASYQAQLASHVRVGQTLCAATTAVFGSLTATVTPPPCLTVNCPALGPGSTAETLNVVSDQKPGSVLFYNLVSSSATNAATNNTRISLTNLNPTRTAYVHLFFVDGSSCAVADSFICLTPNQTASVLHSDIDPGVTGYVIAVATDRTGCPINFNYLIGDEYVKLASGHAANLGAEAIAAVAGGLPLCNATSSEAVLAFNDVSYDAVPRVLALDNFAAPADGNQTLLVVNRVGGYLSTGAFTLGTLFGILYDDSEQALSFSLAGACQLRTNVNGSSLRTTPRVEQFIPTGRSGWLKLYSNSDFGLFGAALNFNPNATTQAGAFNQGHNLHKLRLSQAAIYTIPIFPPSC